MYYAVIYDKFNIVTRVEGRPSAARADQAGRFFTRFGGWYKVVGEEDADLYKSLINA